MQCINKLYLFVSFKEFFAYTILFIIGSRHLSNEINIVGCTGRLKVPDAHLYRTCPMKRTGVTLGSRFAFCMVMVVSECIHIAPVRYS